MALAMMFIHLNQAGSHFNITVSICIKLQDMWVLFVSRTQDKMCLIQLDSSHFNTKISTAIYKPYHAQGHVISLRFKIM